MKTLLKIFILLMFALTGFGAMSGEIPALAGEKPSYAHLPAVGGLMVRQLGSDSLIVELKGTSLPLPEVDTLGTDVVTFTLAGAYLPAVKWERDFNLPLATLVRADQDGENVVFKMRVSSPMNLKAMEGYGRQSPFEQVCSPPQYRRVRGEGEHPG